MLDSNPVSSFRLRESLVRPLKEAHADHPSLQIE